MPENYFIHYTGHPAINVESYTKEIVKLEVASVHVNYNIHHTKHPAIIIEAHSKG